MRDMKAIVAEIERNMQGAGAKELAHAVSNVIREGSLQEGDLLPPIRLVAQELMLSAATVSSAWAQLSRSGMIKTDGRRGSKVASSSRSSTGYMAPVRMRDDIETDLSTGVPDVKLLPQLERIASQLPASDSSYSYLDAPVIPELMSYLVESWPYEAEEILVVDGAMDALQLLVRAHLSFGDKVIVEDPTYPGLLELLRSQSIQVIGIPVTAQGIDVELLAKAMSADIAAVILQPRAHNPTGVSWSHAQAKSVADVLSAYDCLVIEDDSADVCPTRHCMSVGQHIPERTIHIRSFAKSHGPDLRLAAVSASNRVMAEIQRLRQLGQGWSSRLLQQILYFMLTDTREAQRLHESHLIYRHRRSEFTTALAERGIETFGAEGINVWVPVASEGLAVGFLATQGIGVAPGAPFKVAPSGRSGQHIRVTAGLIENDFGTIANAVAEAARIKRHPQMQ